MLVGDAGAVPVGSINRAVAADVIGGRRSCSAAGEQVEPRKIALNRAQDAVEKLIRPVPGRGNRGDLLAGNSRALRLIDDKLLDVSGAIRPLMVHELNRRRLRSIGLSLQSLVISF